MLHVLYPIFNEGYVSRAGASLHRPDLSNEAIRLTRAAHGLLPHDGEVAGLLAPMLLTDARRAARTGPNGELIPLDEQDRSLWRRDLIAEGVALASVAFSRGVVGPYRLQASIAALHDEAPRVEDTDWPQILALVDALADGARLAGHYPVEAVRAHLLERLGDRERAVAHCRAAAERTASIPERDHLLTKGARLEAS